MKNKTVLITGASGSIGTNTLFLLPKYLKKKYNFVLTDIVKPKYKHDYPFMKADISKMESIRKVFKKYKPDIVIHLAANCHKWAL